MRKYRLLVRTKHPMQIDEETGAYAKVVSFSLTDEPQIEAIMEENNENSHWFKLESAEKTIYLAKDDIVNIIEVVVNTNGG